MTALQLPRPHRPGETTEKTTQSVAQARANQLGAATIVRALHAAGVRDVIASPGGRNIPLLLALDRAQDLEVTTVVDERQAGFVALGLALSTRRPVAAVATSGSAAAHYLPAVVEASENEVPLVLVSADRPAELHGFGAPQTLPQQSLLASYVRCSVSLRAPRPGDSFTWVAASVADAVATASGPRPGPVHVNAPFAEPLWDAAASETWPPPVQRRVTRSRTPVCESAARRIADRICASRRGIIVCGPTVGVDRDLGAIARLAECLGWPLLADIASGLRFGPHIGNVISTHEALLASPSFAAAATPDLVLRFGRQPVARSAWEWLERVGQQAHCIHVDPSGQWYDPSLNGDELVASTATEFCAALTPMLEPSTDGDWLGMWRRAELCASNPLAQACDHGFTEASIAGTIVDALDEMEDMENAQLLAGNSMPIRDLDLFVRPRRGALDVFANRGVNGIDGHIATAIGLAAGRPNRPTVALIGDVTALHDLGALALAAQQRSALTLVVVDNRGGGIFEHLPIAGHWRRGWFERRLATTHQTDLAAVGRALGLSVHEVSTREELHAALRQELRRNTASLIVATVDRAASVANRKAALAAVRARLAGVTP